MSKDETTRRQWVVKDQVGITVCVIYATSHDEAIDMFCYPSLKREAYFSERCGETGGWTCEEYL